MYRKKLAVRALTAIAAGALLASNVTAAFAETNAVTTEAVEQVEAEEAQPEETVDVDIAFYEEYATNEVCYAALTVARGTKKLSAKELKKALEENDRDGIYELAANVSVDLPEPNEENRVTVSVEVKKKAEAPEAKTYKVELYVGDKYLESTTATFEEVTNETVAAFVEANYPDYTLKTQHVFGDDTLLISLSKEGSAAEKEIKINYIDADTQETVGSITYHTTEDVTELAPEILAAGLKDFPDYELFDKETVVPIGDEDLNVKVVKKAVEKTYKVEFYENENFLSETEEKLAEVSDETVKAVAEKAYPGYTVEYYKLFEDGTLRISLKKDAPAPAEKVTIEITFVDENGKEIGKGEAVVDKDATEVLKSQVTGLPDGYTIEGDSFAISGTTANVAVKKTETPSPEQAASTVTINYMRGQNVAATQAFTVTGKKGDTFTVTKANVDASVIPSAYMVYKYFDDTTVAYGENVTLQVELKVKNSGNGGGSGSSGGSSVSTGAAGVLTSGSWKLDDKGWWYQYTNNTYAKNGWYTLEWQNRLDWYYFDAAGYLVSGWYTDANGNRYYLHPLHDGTFGRMYTGWNKVDGAWQFFNDNTEAGVYGAWQEGTPVPAELANA